MAWEPSDGHVRGGCEVARRDPRTMAWARTCDEIQLLHELVLRTRAAARALRDVDQLLME